MKYSSYSLDEGLEVYAGAAANGGGSRVNEYTLIMDLYFESSPTNWYAIYQTDINNRNEHPVADNGDADLYYCDGAINSTFYGWGLDAMGAYHNTDPHIPAGQWIRAAFAVNCTNQTIDKYINGEYIGTGFLDGTDGRWSIAPADSGTASFLLFTQHYEQGDYVGTGYVNSIQIRDYAMTDPEIAELGGPSAAGIPIPADLTGSSNTENQ